MLKPAAMTTESRTYTVPVKLVAHCAREVSMVWLSGIVTDCAMCATQRDGEIGWMGGGEVHVPYAIVILVVSYLQVWVGWAGEEEKCTFPMLSGHRLTRI